MKFERLIVQEFLKYEYSQKDNAVIDTYMQFRVDTLSVLILFDNGVNRGTCYMIDDFVFATEKDLFNYALIDNEFLEMVANECDDKIIEWLNE